MSESNRRTRSSVVQALCTPAEWVRRKNQARRGPRIRELLGTPEGAVAAVRLSIEFGRTSIGIQDFQGSFQVNVVAFEQTLWANSAWMLSGLNNIKIVSNCPPGGKEQIAKQAFFVQWQTVSFLVFVKQCQGVTSGQDQHLNDLDWVRRKSQARRDPRKDLSSQNWVRLS